jgi:DNA invertase Pin-like site-specific DNA recombinase
LTTDNADAILEISPVEESTMKVTPKLIVYLRLSRKKKGKNKQETIDDAYGIEAQRFAAEQYRASVNGIIIREYVEIETGRRNDKHRPELEKAVAHTRMIHGFLVIGKLDRLARNVYRTSGLMESGVEFKCCDNPHATKLTIHIIAAMNEDEADRISTRTKEGLAVAVRTKGVKLGSARPGHWDGREHLRGWKQANKQSAINRREKAKQTYSTLIDQIREMSASMSYAKIATALNNEGFMSPRCKPLTACTVHRIINIFEEDNARTSANRRAPATVA